jgi:hypothetical protein
MGAKEFEENYTLAMLVSQTSTEEGREALQKERATQRAIQLEGVEAPVSLPFDPTTATPEELDSWLRSQQYGGYD